MFKNNENKNIRNKYQKTLEKSVNFNIHFEKIHRIDNGIKKGRKEKKIS